jgi:hypothetical protein
MFFGRIAKKKKRMRKNAKKVRAARPTAPDSAERRWRISS